MASRKRRRISAKQKAVLNDIFVKGIDEVAVLGKHKVDGRLFRRWLGQEAFADEVDYRLDSARRQSEFKLALYAPKAADRLIKLIESGKEEPARRACLDIIASCNQRPAMAQAAAETPAEENLQISSRMTPETVSRLLKALAAEK
ncbi:MAG: hypothetical protein KAR47_19415 [Planctomycetes bacterium]|nr:hypothetical protein [Planctomycetota bacterium]